MKKVCVVGSINTDMVVRAKTIPRPGETLLGEQFVVVQGGKGANQAVAAARQGADVLFISRVGCDSFAENALRSLQNDGINIEFVKKDERAPTGVALITLSAEGENAIVVAPGANSLVSVEDVTRARELVAASDVVLAQLEVPLAAVEAAFKIARAAGKTTILNPAPAQTLSDELLSQVLILTPNETEVEVLTGIKVTAAESAKAAALSLHARGVKTVIITLGEKGAFVSSEGTSELVPTRRAKVVDTTAAGDVFSGVLAAALAEDLDLLTAVRRACGAASLSVEKLGAQTSIPYADTLKKRDTVP